MHPSHLKKEYILKQRDDLIKQLILYISPAKDAKQEITDQIKAKVISTMSTLLYDSIGKFFNFIL